MYSSSLNALTKKKCTYTMVKRCRNDVAPDRWLPLLTCLYLPVGFRSTACVCVCVCVCVWISRMAKMEILKSLKIILLLILGFTTAAPRTQAPQDVVAPADVSVFNPHFLTDQEKEEISHLPIPYYEKISHRPTKRKNKLFCIVMKPESKNSH